jgi:hypothetical protein
MTQAKKFAVGVAMTLLTVAVGFFLVKRFAPENVKDVFRV